MPKAKYKDNRFCQNLCVTENQIGVVVMVAHQAVGNTKHLHSVVCNAKDKKSLETRKKLAGWDADYLINPDL
ncbi:MAG: hypothetical protein WCD70_09895 [Alphaproteobacteria bacterium]